MRDHEQRHWKEARLDELTNIIKGQQLNKSEMIKDGRYYALNGGISPSGYTDNWNTKENTITISEGGNSCGFVRFNTEAFWCGGHCYALKDLKKYVDNKYLYYFLKCHEKLIMQLRVGSGLPNIQKKDISKFIVKLPPHEIQTAISSALDLTRLEINILNQQIAKIRKQKRGLMQKLLTGQVRVKV